MVRMIQILEILSGSCEKITQCCDNAAQRGSLVRMANASTDGMVYAFLGFLVLIALVLIGGLVWVAYEDRKVARAMADTSDWRTWYAQIEPTIVDFASLNVSDATQKL